MSEPKTQTEMIGEVTREASVLIAVFGSLDPFFHEPSLPRAIWYACVLTFSATLLFWGMWLERRR